MRTRNSAFTLVLALAATGVWLPPQALLAGTVQAAGTTRVAAVASAAQPMAQAVAQLAHRSLAAPRRAPRGIPYADRPDALQFADALAEQRGINREWLRGAIGQAHQLALVARLMQPAPNGTSKNWQAYRSRFVEPVRIAAGIQFWQTHRAALQRAEQEFGVPAEIIVGVIGVETLYGQHMGDFRVIDALATLAFDFPASHPRAAERARYFRGELEQFLAHHAGAGSSPLTARGSYAGAVGLPQFMPSSQARWAIDYDGDGRIDLARSAQDAIGSVANYFKAHGWHAGMPTHYPVAFDAATLDLEGLLLPDILPTFSAAAFASKGALLEGPGLAHAGPLALIELHNGGEPPAYVAGTENFYVVTRYNWSSYYAMGVITLGRAVRDALPPP